MAGYGELITPAQFNPLGRRTVGYETLFEQIKTVCDWNSLIFWLKKFDVKLSRARAFFVFVLIDMKEQPTALYDAHYSSQQRYNKQSENP